MTDYRTPDEIAAEAVRRAHYDNERRKPTVEKVVETREFLEEAYGEGLAHISGEDSDYRLNLLLDSLVEECHMRKHRKKVLKKKGRK